MNFLKKIVQRALLRLIRVYQRTISPDTGIPAVMFPHGCCRYFPTCSEYTYRAIEKYGMVRGISKGLWRILRCNPFSRGGYDNI